MWRIIENSNNIKPDEIDTISSKDYAYIRKDFIEVPTLDTEGEKIGTHWQYMENKINKKDWELYQSIMSNMANIDYLAMMTGIEL